MHNALITFAIVVAVVLVHFSYVDFRFRYRDGIMWFWLLSPAPPLMWTGRLTIVAALIFAIAGPFIGINQLFALILCGIMVLHIVTLILLEVLEPR
jgi:hypothetical protein